jgi:hypothetical protein
LSYDANLLRDPSAKAHDRESTHGEGVYVTQSCRISSNPHDDEIMPPIVPTSSIFYTCRYVSFANASIGETE